jgi:hypothetical protein
LSAFPTSWVVAESEAQKSKQNEKIFLKLQTHQYKTYSILKNITGGGVMKILKTLGVLVTIVMLVISCASESEKLRKESKEDYPNQEWRRPPAHWSPP